MNKITVDDKRLRGFQPHIPTELDRLYEAASVRLYDRLLSEGLLWPVSLDLLRKRYWFEPVFLYNQSIFKDYHDGFLKHVENQGHSLRWPISILVGRRRGNLDYQFEKGWYSAQEVTVLCEEEAFPVIIDILEQHRQNGLVPSWPLTHQLTMREVEDNMWRNGKVITDIELRVRQHLKF